MNAIPPQGPLAADVEELTRRRPLRASRSSPTIAAMR